MFWPALLLSVALAPPFGEAEATAVDAGPPLVVDVTVHVDGDFEAVLLRAVSTTGELEPVAMSAQDDGGFATILRLTEREDVEVVFEAIGSNGESEISTAHRLTELGVDPAIFALATTTTAEPVESSTDTTWLVVSLIALLAALLLVVVWTTTPPADETAPPEAD